FKNLTRAIRFLDQIGKEVDSAVDHPCLFVWPDSVRFPVAVAGFYRAPSAWLFASADHYQTFAGRLPLGSDCFVFARSSVLIALDSLSFSPFKYLSKDSTFCCRVSTVSASAYLFGTSGFSFESRYV